MIRGIRLSAFTRNYSLSSFKATVTGPWPLYSWYFDDSRDKVSSQGCGASVLDCRFHSGYWQPFDLDQRAFLASCFIHFQGKESLPSDIVKPRIPSASYALKFFKHCFQESRSKALSEQLENCVFGRHYDLITAVPSYQGPYADDQNDEILSSLVSVLRQADKSDESPQPTRLNLIQRLHPLSSSSTTGWEEIADSLVLDFTLYDLIAGKRILLWGTEANQEIDLIRTLLFAAGASRVDFCTAFGDLSVVQESSTSDSSVKNSGNVVNCPPVDPSRSAATFLLTPEKANVKSRAQFSDEQLKILLRMGSLNGKPLSQFLRKESQDRAAWSYNSSMYGNDRSENVMKWHDHLGDYIKKKISVKQLSSTLRNH